LEVELLRQRLDDAGIRELEFEASTDGRGWAMLVESSRVGDIDQWLWEAAAIALGWRDPAAGAEGAEVEHQQRERSRGATAGIEARLDSIIWGGGLL
jgi:hypothetical protein